MLRFLQKSDKRIIRAATILVVSALIGNAALATTAAPKATAKPRPLQSLDYEDQFISKAPVGTFDSALAFVRGAGITKNLSLLLLQDVKNTATVQSAIKRMGMDRVQLHVIKAIRAAQKSHEGEWAKVLAGIYSQHFSSRELRSIMKKRDASPHFVRMLELQATISDAVLTHGRAVFSQAREDVLGDLDATFSRQASAAAQ